MNKFEDSVNLNLCQIMLNNAHLLSVYLTLSWNWLILLSRGIGAYLLFSCCCHYLWLSGLFVAVLLWSLLTSMWQPLCGDRCVALEKGFKGEHYSAKFITRWLRVLLLFGNYHQCWVVLQPKLGFAIVHYQHARWGFLVIHGLNWT